MLKNSGPVGHQGEHFNLGLNNVNIWGIRQSTFHQKFGCGLQERKYMFFYKQ